MTPVNVVSSDKIEIESKGALRPRSRDAGGCGGPLFDSAIGWGTGQGAVGSSSKEGGLAGVARSRQGVEPTLLNAYNFHHS